ncbi:6293_t:CDS:2 [Entrophospora sp. SA101]|nr:6293_t:CDS:2 [Entrophospora sp. SA101]
MINIKKLIKKRIISANPELVLDAPRMINDYYLNLLDWSNKNMVAVGLDKNAFANTSSGARIIDNKISSLSWSEDGDHLADLGMKHDVRLARHKFAELHDNTSEVCGLKWRSDDEQLASGGNNDNKVNIWDAKSSIPKFIKTDHKDSAIAWCLWQRILLATGEGAADQQIYFLNTDASEVLSIHEYPSFRFIIWKYPSLKKIIDVKDAHENRILQSALSPEGEIVATVAEINYC